jgi:Gluconate 2-dehydrogenase subunit 3
MANQGITRRRLLASTPILAVAGFGLPALGRTYRGGSLPWEPNDTSPPIPVRAGPWLYFTADEAAAVEAIADRLIPPDDSGPGGKQAGCAVFIDRQLAGSFGPVAAQLSSHHCSMAQQERTSSVHTPLCSVCSERIALCTSFKGSQPCMSLDSPMPSCQ